VIHSNFIRDHRTFVLVASFAAILLILLGGLFTFWPTPQMGGDEDVMSAVDALFTAVTARDDGLLAQCEKRLLELKSQSKLPRGAANRLEGIIAEARSGSWEPAARRLYSFIESQRI
jgi:hypothetical protein